MDLDAVQLVLETAVATGRTDRAWRGRLATSTTFVVRRPSDGRRSAIQAGIFSSGVIQVTPAPMSRSTRTCHTVCSAVTVS